MKKHLSSMMALLLVFSLVFGLIPMPVRAEGEEETAVKWELPVLTEEKKNVRLVSLGDSTSNGYYLEGYTAQLMGMGSNASTDSYPVKLYGDLVDLYGEENVIFSQYCINTTRWSELAAYMDSYFGFDSGFYVDRSAVQTKAWTEEDFYEAAFNPDGVASYAGIQYLGDPSSYGEYTNYATDEYLAFPAAFKDSILNADFITIDLGVNAFGTWISQRLLDDLEGYVDTATKRSGTEENGSWSYRYLEDLTDIRDEIISSFSSEVLASIRALEADLLSGVGDFSPLVAAFQPAFGCTTLAELFNALDALPLETSRAYYDQIASTLWDSGNGFSAWLIFDIIEGLMYSYGSTILNCDRALGYIYEVNPDVMIIVNGLYNGMKGLALTYGDMRVEIGDMLNVLGTGLNAFFAGDESALAQNKYKDRMRFNELPGDIATWIDNVISFTGDPVASYSSVDQNTLELMVDMLYGLVDNVEGLGDNDELAKAIGTTLLEGIQESVSETVEEELAGNGETAGQAAITGIKKYCCENGEYLIGNDIKKAYSKNTMTIDDLSVDTSSLSSLISNFGIIMRYPEILSGNYTNYINDTFSSESYAYFFVAYAFDTIRQNMQKAAAYTEIDMAALIEAFSGEGEVSETIGAALSDFDNADAAAKSLLQVALRFTSASGVGTHPSPEGMLAKYEYIKKCMPKAAFAIYYLKTDGSEAAEPCYKTGLTEGMPYRVVSPTVSNYTADTPVVSGIVGDGPVEITVTYVSSTEKNNYLISLIDTIGEVTYTEECFSTIQKCRTLYDSVSSSSRSKITNSATLTNAETAFAALEAQETPSVVVVRSAKKGGTQSVATLTGGGAYYSVRGGEITAPETVNGLTFAGWYKELTGELYSSSASICVKPQSDLMLTAVYTAKAGVTYGLTVNADSFEYITAGMKEAKTAAETFTLTPASEVKIKYTGEGTEVLLWKDASFNTYGYCDIVSLVVNQDIALTPVVIPEGQEAKYVYVTFVNGNDNSVISRALCCADETITFPNAPTVSRKTFQSWSMTAEQIAAACAGSNEITVTASYKSSGGRN